MGPTLRHPVPCHLPPFPAFPFPFPSFFFPSLPLTSLSIILFPPFPFPSSRPQIQLGSEWSLVPNPNPNPNSRVSMLILYPNSNSNGLCNHNANVTLRTSELSPLYVRKRILTHLQLSKRMSWQRLSFVYINAMNMHMFFGICCSFVFVQRKTSHHFGRVSTRKPAPAQIRPCLHLSQLTANKFDQSKSINQSVSEWKHIYIYIAPSNVSESKEHRGRHWVECSRLL